MDAEQIPRSDVLGLFVSFETGVIRSIGAQTQRVIQVVRMTTVACRDYLSLQDAVKCYETRFLHLNFLSVTVLAF